MGVLLLGAAVLRLRVWFTTRERDLADFGILRRRVLCTIRWRTWSVCLRRSWGGWRLGPISRSEFDTLIVIVCVL